jgi:hypothetical protein
MPVPTNKVSSYQVFLPDLQHTREEKTLNNFADSLCKAFLR